MALTPLSDDLNIIAALHDEPNVDDGLTAAQLKAKFDESGNKIKTYINGTLKDFVEDLEDGTGLADGSVTTSKLADEAVTTAKIDDLAVTGAKIANGAVDTNQLASLAVLTAKIGDLAVTTNKIANKNVVKAKLDDSLQASINLADSAYQKPGTGIPKTDLASAVQTSLGKADTALQSANDVYWVTYNTTTNSAIENAISQNKLVCCVYNGRTYVLDDRQSATYHAFACPSSDGDTIYTLKCSSNTWSNNSVSVYHKPGTGIPKADLASSVQTSLGLADTALQSAHEVPSGGASGQVLAKNSNTDYDLKWVNQSGGGGTPYTSNPAALGTASPGSSDNYSRGDHVHPKPSASDIGAIAEPTSGSAGQVLTLYDNSGNLEWIAANPPYEVYWAEYGVTAASYIKSVSHGNVVVMCEYTDGNSNRIYLRHHETSSDSKCYFYGRVDSTGEQVVAEVSGSTWTITRSYTPVAPTEVTVSTAGAVTQALDAGKMYHFTGALTALTITLNAAAAGQLAQYHFDFDCGSTAPTVTIPNTVTMPDGNSFAASKHYEVDILNNYGAVLSWANS